MINDILYYVRRVVSEDAGGGFSFTIFPNGSHHITPRGRWFIICYHLSPLSIMLLHASDHLPIIDLIPTTSFLSDHVILIPYIISGSHDHMDTPHVNIDIYAKLKLVDLMLIEFNYPS